MVSLQIQANTYFIFLVNSQLTSYVYSCKPCYSEVLSASLMKFLSGQEDRSMFETSFHYYCLDCRKQHTGIWCV